MEHKTYKDEVAFRFQNFPIYKESRIFVQDVYLLSKTLPRCEEFSLISQIRRAACSILLNIAEGSAKKSDAEFNRFLMICVGSVTEIVAILDICLDQKYISTENHGLFLSKCENLARQLYGFSRKLTKPS